MSARLLFGSPAENILDLALSSGAQAAEAFFQQGVELRARAFEGALAELTSAQARGAGLRTFGGGRMGFASTSDLGEESLRRLVKMALEVQAHTDPDAFAGLPDATIETNGAPAPGDLGDGRIDWRAGTRERSRLALELDARATSCRPAVRRTAGAVYSDERVHTELHSSRGVHAAFEATVAYAFVEAVAERGDEVQSGFGFTFARSPDGLDVGGCALEAAAGAESMLGARTVRSGAYPVVFENRAWAALLGSMTAAITAQGGEGVSALARRIGEPVAAPGVSLVDDPCLPQGLASRPWDDEGVPSGRTAVIERGVLRSLLHNSETARRAGLARSTSNASRESYRSAPEVGATNLVFRAGEGSLEELLNRMGDGLLVTELSGLHTVDGISGDFSLGVSGFKVRRGRRGRPVRQTAIAGNVFTLLAEIEGIAGDLRFLYDACFIGAPSILVRSLAVSSD